MVTIDSNRQAHCLKLAIACVRCIHCVIHHLIFLQEKLGTSWGCQCATKSNKQPDKI